jgi:hypothetical protein
MTPIHINEDWNVITPTIPPLVWQPSLQPAADHSVRHWSRYFLGTSTYEIGNLCSIQDISRRRKVKWMISGYGSQATSRAA